MPNLSIAHPFNAPDTDALVAFAGSFFRIPNRTAPPFPAALLRSPFFLGYITGALEALVQRCQIPEHRHAHLIGSALDQLFPNLPPFTADVSHGAGQVCGLAGMRRYLAGGPACHLLDWMQPADTAPSSSLRAHAAAIARAMRAAGHGPRAFSKAFPPIFQRQVGQAFRPMDTFHSAIAESVMLALSL